MKQMIKKTLNWLFGSYFFKKEKRLSQKDEFPGIAVSQCVRIECFCFESNTNTA